MARNLNIRIQAQVLQADEDAFLALKVIADYKPANPAYNVEALAMKYQAMRAAEEAELHAQHALSAARDAAVIAQWEYHDLILGVKDQIVAQYGPDSDQLASLGLKKKSERRPPARLSKPST